MPDVTPSADLVRFADFDVDLRAGHLRKQGLRIRLPEQSFQVLAILLQHAGQVVTREDLRGHIWPEGVFVDFEAGLNTAVSRLREALNDSAEHPRFIETIPKRGYRFLASLSAPAAPVPRLLVLPFDNLSGDPGQEYFSDAMTDEIISALANLAPGNLAVLARTTSLHYKGRKKDIPQIGRYLAVDYIVEGTVRRTGERIAVNAHLIRARDQTHVWANRYDADLSDLFNLESAVAQAIAAEIGIPFRCTARKHTQDLDAYNLYIQGRYYFDQGNPEALAKARLCYEQAVARDANFALAYDGLAELHYYLGFFGFLPPKEALSTGIFHVLRALEIDSTMAETHALLGQYRKQLDYDWAEVRREMNRARELNPASPVVRMRYAVNGLMPFGRIAEAVSELEAALESDPLSRMVRIWLGVILWLGREYDRGIEQGRLLLDFDPANPHGYYVIGNCYREKRMFDEAVAAHRKATELSGGAPLYLGWLGLAVAQSGNSAEARAMLERLHATAAKVYVPPTSFAWIHLGLGEIDSAFTWLDRAIDARDHMMTGIKTIPCLDPIRADPRYFALLRRMNLER